MKPPTIIHCSGGGVPQHPVYWFCHVCATAETLPLGVAHACMTEAHREAKAPR